ncbi:hypothetical protein MAR_035041 [Mya arenaria]|uniref:MADF domain-containing protein n=1 Tax=Mya arenaria TaxID=6604 RepID=A0ABY7EJ02_MYAAR|nr:hypothetical protein MAR_035041 [Mya arenaria]
MVDWLREHPLLFNKKLSLYKDKGKKDALWAEQARKLGKEVVLLTVWYRSIRTRYGKLARPKGLGLATAPSVIYGSWTKQQLHTFSPNAVKLESLSKEEISMKTSIVDELKRPDSSIRLLLATEACGMGVDIPDENREANKSAMVPQKMDWKTELRHTSMYLCAEIASRFKPSRKTRCCMAFSEIDQLKPNN